VAAVLTLFTAAPALADSNAVERHWKQGLQARSAASATLVASPKADIAKAGKPTMASCDCCVDAAHRHPSAE